MSTENSEMFFHVDPENEDIKEGLKYLQEIIDKLMVCNREEFLATYKKARKAIEKNDEGVANVMRHIEKHLRKIPDPSFYLIAGYIVFAFIEMIKNGKCFDL